MKKWTKSEEMILLQGVGANSIDWLCRKLRKSRAAVDSKLYRMFRGGISRGTYSLKEIIDITGYSRSHLIRARKALKQKWKRTSNKGIFLITDDQIEELADWLGLDYWSRSHHLYKCIWCYTSDNPHRSYGLCTECYKEYDNLIRKLGLPRSIVKLKEIIVNYKDTSLMSKTMLGLEKKRAIPRDILQAML